MTPPQSNKSAFTLIELLVVIAIIAILAALAMTGLSGAIENARSLTEANNLSTLGKSLNGYLNEREDQMPSLVGGTSTWPELLRKGISDYKVFVSPFDKRAVTNGPASPCSFGINSNNFGISASDFYSPSELIMMAPAQVTGGTKPVFSGTMAANVSLTSSNTQGIFRRQSMINVLFADGHVVPMSFLDFKDTSSAKGQRRWMPTYVDPSAP
jgi:prepilin-type N-terminal cleavage/methylation domain-containing protein/prepilin-type processing-associated H-X9-DG protein